MVTQSIKSGLQRIGILLCGCEGKIANKADLTKIYEWMMENYPMITFKTNDALCKKPDEIGSFIKQNNLTNMIVGACRRFQELFEETSAKADLKPFCLKTVSLLEQCTLDYSTEDTIEKTKIMLFAAVSRERKFGGVTTENLKLTKIPLDKKMDRRSFLTYPIKYQHQITPTIDDDRCTGWRGCNICMATCPKKAFSTQRRKIQLNISKCEGCGICMVTCPVGAIMFPTHSLPQIDEEISSLVSANAGSLEPRIILFACNGGVSLLDELASKEFSYAPNMLVVEVPCIGMITPFTMLRTLAAGAEAAALIPCQKNCAKEYDLNNMKENVQISRELLKIFGKDPKRICAIKLGDGSLDEFHTRLNTFNENIMKLGPHSMKDKEPTQLNIPQRHLLYLVKHLAEKCKIKKNAKVYNSDLPFWTIETNADKCTFCGSCASHCPTNAINLKQEEAQVKLMFNYGLCLACGNCIRYCPEKAINRKNVLDLSRLNSSESILITGEMAKCEKCGNWFAPQKQIELVASRVSIKSEKHFLSLLKYCSNCRLKTELMI